MITDKELSNIRKTVYDALIHDGDLDFDLKTWVIAVFVHSPKQKFIPDEILAQEKHVHFYFAVRNAINQAFIDFTDETGQTIDKWGDQLIDELPKRFSRM
jgi:hypothetical protein